MNLPANAGLVDFSGISYGCTLTSEERLSK